MSALLTSAFPVAASASLLLFFVSGYYWSTGQNRLSVPLFWACAFLFFGVTTIALEARPW